jgi:hypothetical protein
MKEILLSFIALTCFVQLSKGQVYLSDIPTKNDNRTSNNYLIIPFNYWRYDTCLYNTKVICKYNHGTAADVKINNNGSVVSYEFLRGNNSGYQSKHPYDTFRYTFGSQDINTSLFVRTLLIRDVYIRTDTFKLTAIDTLLFDNYRLLKKIFGKSELDQQRALKIYVLKSVDRVGSTMLHYWVQRIGIIKLTDEKCWRYSFEMKDNRTAAIEKMFSQLLQTIKTKYKDPYWLSVPCTVE